MTPVILGLDISLSCTGWCLLSLEEDRVVKWGKISTKASKRGSLNDSDYYIRVHRIVQGVEAVFDIPEIVIVSVAVEQLNSFRGGDVSRRLMGVSKIVQYTIWKNHGLTPNEINTMTAKKVFTGNGQAEKTLVLVMANHVYKLSPQLVWLEKKTDKEGRSDEDIADSISIAHTLKKEIGEQLLKTFKQ